MTIQVISYDGYKGNERPKAVVVDGQRLDVEEIEKSWIASGPESDSVVVYGFVVRCAGRVRFELHYDERSGWTARAL